MIVKSIYLNNFRNFDELKLNFSDKINVLIGKNGIGKTNILESIYISLAGTSFKSVKQDEYIKFGSDFALGKAIVEEKKFENEISFLFNNKKKIFKIDDIKIKSISELYDFSNVIVFFPDEIRIITENSIFRRNFLDSFIMKLVRGYKQKLNIYKNVIFRRNMLLKGRNLSSYYKQEMNALTKKAIELCYDISFERHRMIKLINDKIPKIHRELCNEDLKIEYHSILEDYSISKIDALNKILEEFSKSYKKDVETRVTNFGVHKEDFSFLLNSKNSKNFSSQGQKRNIIISTKMAQKDIFEEKKGIKPIILLDDLFSELDENRRFGIINYLRENQVFITTTDMSFVDGFDVNIINL